MKEKFELFRLSLTERKQGSILNPKLNREQYLRGIFTNKVKFSHSGNDFHYVPSNTEEQGTLIGNIGRNYVIDENSSPEEGFTPTSHEGWKAAVLIIDPTSHKDGQKIAMNNDKRVGNPISLLESFVKQFNNDTHSPYHIEIEPIFNPTHFWDWAKENKGSVTSLTFEFVTPNMFGSIDEVSEELKKYRDEENAQRVEIKIKSDDGLSLDTERVKASVEYVTKGTGSITGRAKGNKIYSSKKKTNYVILEDEEASTESLLVRATKKMSRLLGRE